MNKPPPGIASHYAAMSTLRIPQGWSPEQALAVWELLDAITQCVWERYDVQLVELIRDDLYGDDTSQLDLFDPNDTIPF